MGTNAVANRFMALILLLPLAACSQSDHGNSEAAQAMKEAQQQTSPTLIGAEIQKGIDKAKQELLTKDIDVTNVHSGSHHHDSNSRPKAAITPDGQLVIEGRRVDATPEQHALLLDYRQQIIGIATAGMDIGASSADMGLGIAKDAIFGKLSGKSDKEIEADIKPQTDKIEAAAVKLCKRMPELMVSQQKLAAAMPAFQPYATMTQKDIDDCGKHTDENGKQGFAVFSD
jgi:cobalamin biosynthesis protein CobT